MTEEKQTQKLIARKNRLLAGVRASKRFTEKQITDYIDEAEHQDGYEYWLQFKTWQSLARDIKIYYENAG